MKNLAILIGDDMFAMPVEEMTVRSQYITPFLERNPSVRIETLSRPQRVIDEAKTGKYGIVVTDLNYSGDGSGTQGYDVIDALNQLNPKPRIVLCTSTDKPEVKERVRGKIDFFAGSQEGHKFTTLFKYLSEIVKPE